MEWLTKLWNLIFGSKKEESVVVKYPLIKNGSTGDYVIFLKKRINLHFGSDVLDDKNDKFGDSTEATVKSFQKLKGLEVDGIVYDKTWVELNKNPEKIATPPTPVIITPPWMVKARKYIGMTEFMPSFVAFLETYWAKVGLPSYKGLAGSARAWCGLFVVAMLIGSGLSYQKDGAGAKNHAKYGIAVDYVNNGIPEGAIIHVNPTSCTSGSGNHVTFANGDCAPQDIIEMEKNSKGVWVAKAKSGATFGGLGGNQGNAVKVSIYKVSTICAVRWPKEVAPPRKILISRNCTGTGSANESTR